MHIRAKFRGRGLLPGSLFSLGALASYLNDSIHALSIDPLQDPYPYEFPGLENANENSLFPMPLCGDVVIEEATIDQLQDYMHQGMLTAMKLAHCYWKRVLQTNDYCNSVLELNPDFLDIAAALDIERAAGKVRGPLHGIPFLVKDNIATKDKMETTAGSWALLGSVVPRDAFVVSRLREAGAVLLGKATLSEWADMRSNNYSEGFSPRGGQARSPYNLTVNPGGSSSGSAAAVAANIVPFSLGTETDGSVISPAERNAVVGFKPTVGLTSRAGVIPECEHQDTVGTFGKTVRDAVYAVDAIYGVDSRDNYTLIQQGKTPAGGYAQFLTSRFALSNATFGIPWESFWQYAPSEQIPPLLAVLDILRAHGATIVNGTEIPSRDKTISPDGWDWDYGSTRGYSNESEYTVVKVDFYNNIRTYLSELENTSIRSLEDIVQYNYNNDGTSGGNPWPLGIPAFYSGQDGFLASLATKGVRDKTYWSALSFMQRATREYGIDGALLDTDNSNTTDRYRNVDVLLVPPDVGQTYQIAAQAGYPMITLPLGVGRENGMPFGLALMASAWEEKVLVRLASAVEDAQSSSVGNKYKRTLPRWLGHLEKNVPVVAGGGCC